MVANNPTQLALVESKLLWPHENLHCLVSIGSGKPITQSVEDNAPVSTKDLFPKAIDVLADTETTHHVLEMLIDEKYYRLNPTLETMIELNDIREPLLQKLRCDTETYIEKNMWLISKVANSLTEQPSYSESIIRMLQQFK